MQYKENMNRTVQPLPHGVVKLISSTQVISSISSVVKELVENAIDAGATIIDIKLERYGLNKVEVRDNGNGIRSTDIINVCLPHSTSKIHSLDDLKSLESYGFRGEALNSLCSISDVSISTRTENDDVAFTYHYDNNGNVLERKPNHQLKGTTVTAINLFKNVPVRKQFYENPRKATDELKRIEKIVKMLSAIHTKLRVTLAHNKCLIWTKTSVTTLKKSFAQFYPYVSFKNLEFFSHSVGENNSQQLEVFSEIDDLPVKQLLIEMLIVKRDSNWSALCQSLSDAIHFYINYRPVKDKKVEKVVIEEMTYLFQSALPTNKCPLTVISLHIPPKYIDVNLEPDKSKVLMENHEEVLKEIREAMMIHFYKQPVREMKLPESESENNNPRDVKKRKINNFDIDEETDEIVVSPSKKQCALSTISNTSRHLEKKENIDDLVTKYRNVNDDLINEICSIKKTPDKISPAKRISNDGSLRELSYNGDLVSGLFQTQTQKQEITISDKSTILFDDDHAFDIPHINSALIDDNTNSRISKEDIVHIDRTPATKADSTSKIKCNGSSKVVATPITEVPNPGKTFSQTTISQWSKGHVFLNDNLVKGPEVLVTEENGRKPDENTTNSKVNSTGSKGHVNKQKEFAGLTSFTQTVKSEIINDNPGIPFNRLASELANRWRKLDDNAKNEFAKKSKSHKMVHKPTNGNFLPAAGSLVSKRVVQSSKSIMDIRNNLGIWSSRRNETKVKLISYLDSQNEYLCRIGNRVILINLLVLRENIQYHRYLSNFSVTKKKLETPIPITNVLENRYLSLLLSLKTYTDEEQHIISISDRRITDNGFDIIKEDDGQVTITSVAAELEFEPIDNLIEILCLINDDDNNNNDLFSCRTKAIKRILYNKAEEYVAEKKVIDDADILSIINYWVDQMALKNLLHEHLFVKVFNFASVDD